MSDQERLRLRGEVDKAQARATELDGDRLGAVSVAEVKLVPRPDLGPCPIAFPSAVLDLVLAGDTRGSPRHRLGLDSTLAASHITYQDKTGWGSTLPRGVGLARFSGVASAIAGDKDPDPAAFAQLERALQPSEWGPELAVVVEKKAAPSVAVRTRKEFEGGAVLGRAFVYDYAAKAVVCASAFTASNSDNVTVRMEKGKVVDGSELEIDLALQAVAAARKQLFKAGPPREDAPSPP